MIRKIDTLSKNGFCTVIAIFIVIIVHIFASPTYFALSPACKPCPDCCNMQEKINRRDHLLESVKDKYDPPTHMAKSEFRLTPPLLFKILGIKTKLGAYLLQLFAGLIFFYFCAQGFLKMMNDRYLAAFLTLSIAFIYTGYSFVAEMEGFFDSFAYLFLLLCLLDLPIAFLLPFALLAFFTDERAILASMLIVFYWQIKNSTEAGHSFFSPSKQSIVITLTVVFYIAARWALIHYFGFQNQFEGTNALPYTFNYLGLTFWQAFEGFWLFIALAVYLMYKQKQFLQTCFFILITSLIFIAGHFVMDITRSVAYTFPAIWLAVYLTSKYFNIDKLRLIVYACLFFCFVFPSYSYIAGKPPHFYKPIYMRVVGKFLNIP